MDEQRSESTATATIRARRFDVFLSYNSRDKPSVERIAEKLKRAGLEPWLDSWCLTPGGHWQNELAEGLRASGACAVFVGPSDLGDWENQELAAALDRAAKEPTFRVFLVLLPGLPEPFDPTTLSPFVSTRTWVDLRKGIGNGRELQSLVNAVKGVPLGPEVPLEPREDVSPYRGLQRFDEADAEFFFGRDSDVQRLLEKLKTTRFLAVLGASGSGKSSLVRAGLLPAMRRAAPPVSTDALIAVLTPGSHPLVALASQLLRLHPADGMQKTVDGLRHDLRTLHLAGGLALGDRPADEPIVWVIDQFEEVFTLCRDEDERAQFFANLLYAASIPGGRAMVVLTLRADFYHKCAAHPELSQRIAAQQFLVSPIDGDGLRQVIEEPARRVGLVFEEGLVATILEEVHNQPGALPLLEHALLELWERRRGGMLTLEGYRESGGVTGAIAKRADEIYSRFTPDEQAIARRTLLRLTQPGEGTEDTRRRATLEELVPRAGEEEAVEEVVRALVDARMLTASADELTDGRWIDVSHEALIRGWPRLREWLDEDRAGLLVHRRLTEAAQEWKRHDRDESVLYRGARLAEAIEWRSENEGALNELEREFVDASVALEERERSQEEVRRRKERRGRVLALVTAVSLVVLVVIGVLAWFAFKQRNEATRERDIASSRELAASAIERLFTDPELSTLLALEALSHAQTGQAEDALRRAAPELSKYTFGESQGPAVSDVVLSPDRRLVATASADGTASLWNAATGHAGPLMAHHKDCSVPDECGVNDLAFSPDAKRLATASADGTARLWDTATGDPRSPPLVHHKDDAVNDVVFSWNGNLVATASDDGTARLWDTATGDPRSPPLVHNNDCAEECAVNHVVFSPDGKRFATASDDGTARLWNAATGVAGPLLVHNRETALRSVAFSPDGTRLATGSYDGTVRLWNTATGDFDLQIRDNKESVRDVHFSSSGRQVLTAGEDGTSHIWNAATGEVVSVLSGHEALVASAAFSPDGALVVTASEDKTARVWDAKSGEELTVLRGHTAFVRKAAFSRDGKLVVTVSDDGTARVWDAPQVVRLQSTEAVTDFTFSSNGEFIATATEDGARIWDLRASEPKLAYPDRLLPDTEVSAVTFNSDGTRLATATEDGARIWDVTVSKPKLISVVLSGAEVSAVAFSSDGTRLAAATEDGARIWDVTVSKPVSVFLRGTEVSAVAFSSDGTRLATATEDDNRALIWNVAASKPRIVFKLSGHTDVVNDVVFSADSKLLATASDDGTANIWSAASGARLVRFTGQAGDVTSVAFSSDGRFVVTGGTDKVARVWKRTTGQEFAVLRGAADDINSAVFTPDNRTVAAASEDGTVRLYPCEVCLSIEELRRLAGSRVDRELRPDERAIYLHER